MRRSLSGRTFAGERFHRPRSMWAGLALIMGFGASVSALAAQDVAELRLRALAATCAHCHGTDGQAVAGEDFVRLAGRSQDEIRASLLAFRSGQRAATVMQQITRGYSLEQLEALAHYFGARRQQP